MQDPTSTTQLTELNLIGALNNVLSQHMDDEDLVEKSLDTLKTFFNESASVDAASKALIHHRILEAKAKYSKAILAAEDWAELEQKSA
jgi:hypothetical protein